MVKSLKVSSLQNLVRNSYLDEEKVRRELMRFAKGFTVVSYQKMDGFVVDLARMNLSLEDVEKAANRIKPEKNRQVNLELLPFVEEYIQQRREYDYQEIDLRCYPLSRDLRVPFKSQFVLVNRCEVILPVFIFWRNKALDTGQMSLFMTLIKEILEQEPDLEDAKVQIVDFGAPKSKAPRTMEVIHGDEIELLSEEEKIDRLAIYVNALKSVNDELARNSTEAEKRPATTVDNNQLSFL